MTQQQKLLLAKDTNGAWEIHQRVDGRTVGFIHLGPQGEESGVLNAARELINAFNWLHEDGSGLV